MSLQECQAHEFPDRVFYFIAQLLLFLGSSRVGNRADLCFFLRDPCGILVAPCGLDQHAPGLSVASLGDAAATDGSSAGVLGRNQTEVSHQETRRLEAAEIAGGGSGHVLAGDARGHHQLRHASSGEDAPVQGGRRNIFVFMQTNTFNNDPFYSNGASARFSETTNDTGEVVALAVRLGERLWPMASATQSAT
jgi:hypothetical protein